MESYPLDQITQGHHQEQEIKLAIVSDQGNLLSKYHIIIIKTKLSPKV